MNRATEVKVLGILQAVLVLYSLSSLTFLRTSLVRTLLTSSSHSQVSGTPIKAACLCLSCSL